MQTIKNEYFGQISFDEILECFVATLKPENKEEIAVNFFLEPDEIKKDADLFATQVRNFINALEQNRQSLAKAAFELLVQAEHGNVVEKVSEESIAKVIKLNDISIYDTDAIEAFFLLGDDLRTYHFMVQVDPNGKFSEPQLVG